MKNVNMRSKARHDEWQKLLKCRQITLNGADDLEENFEKIKKLMESPIGRMVTVTVDRPIGSRHPEYRDTTYPVNYGYIQGLIAPDGEEQDAYILGVNEAMERFKGKVIAIIYRKNDIEEKWVVGPENMSFSKEYIQEKTYFQEKYFDSEIMM